MIVRGKKIDIVKGEGERVEGNCRGERRRNKDRDRVRQMEEKQ